jgi:hypothetical protein
MLEELREKLHNLGRLGPKWDGLGALPIDPLAIHEAERVLQLVCPLLPYNIRPLPNGRIELRMRSEFGELILEITNKDRLNFTLIPYPDCGADTWLTGEVKSKSDLRLYLAYLLVGDKVLSKDKECKSLCKPKMPENRYGGVYI